MKYIWILLILFLSSCNWSAKERMVEVKHTNNKIDTVSIYTHHFELINNDLYGIRSKIDGGNIIISKNVSSYKVLK